MPIYRANVILQGKTGLPEDQFVTTFHFDVVDSNPQVNIDEGAAIAGRLISLYNTAPVQADAVAARISPFVSRVADDSEVRVYNLDDPPNDRIPYVQPFTLGASSAPSAPGLPGEVAFAVSYYATNNVPRQRGRVYFGPLSSVILSDDASDVPRLFLGDINAFVTAVGRLRDSNTANATWVVWSRPKEATVNKDGTPNPARPGTAYPITHVWADNEYDTVRRRGAKATTRTTV